jgi:hypothetical protein
MRHPSPAGRPPQESQGASSALLGELRERQDALAAEVGALRKQLRDMRSRREDLLWL